MDVKHMLTHSLIPGGLSVPFDPTLISVFDAADNVGGHSGDVVVNQCSDGVAASAAGDGRSESRGQGSAGEVGHAQGEAGAGLGQDEGVRENQDTAPTGELLLISM